MGIVYDWLTVYGGSERLLSEILQIFPGSELHALLHHAPVYKDTPLANRKVHTTFLQALPGVHNYYRSLLPLMPLAIQNLDVSAHRVVLCVSHAVAHGVKTNENQIHIAYICTPMRYAWHLREDYLHLHHLDRRFTKGLATLLLDRIRSWDKKSAQQADKMIAISRWSADRVHSAWGRNAHVIYPPVQIERFQASDRRDNFYLLVMRLVPYKRGLEIVKAFNSLKLPLVIVGTGPELSKLQQAAGNTIKILGHQPDSVVTGLMNRAKAFVYMAVEDFGIAMVEAQAAGCPTIAYRKGGAGEIVIDGETGILFDEQTADALADAVSQFEQIPDPFDRRKLRNNAARFSKEIFRQNFTNYLKPYLDG